MFYQEILFDGNTVLLTSALPYSTFGDRPQSERWGDYSAVAIDLVSGNRRSAWFVNQKNNEGFRQDPFPTGGAPASEA